MPDAPALPSGALAAVTRAAEARFETPREAADAIRAWRHSLRAIGALAEAQVMAACWTIRQHHPTREAMSAFVAAECGGAISPDRAWLLAETWNACRRQRVLRAVASSQPAEAIAFVREFTAAVSEPGQPSLTELDEDDRDVVSILSAPPRRRRERIRALLAARRRDPAPQAEAAPEPPSEPEAPTPATVTAQVGAAINGLQRAETDLAAAEDRLSGAIAVHGLNEAQRARILRLTDMAVATLDRLADAAAAEAE